MNSSYLLLVLEASPLVRSSGSTCSPSRQTDRSPTTSAGSLSPTRCSVTTTCSTEKIWKIILLHDKKSAFYSRSQSQATVSKGKNTPNKPQNSLHIFFQFRVVKQIIFRCQKGENWSISLLLPKERINIRAEIDSCVSAHTSKAINVPVLKNL